MRFNLNDTVVIELTEYGAEVLNLFYKDLLPNWPIPGDEAKKEEIKQFTIWNFMSIFGNQMYNGNPKLCFKNNEIEINRRK